MKMKTVVLLGLLCFVLGLSNLSVALREPRTFYVNLDLPPDQRWPWEQMIPHYIQYLDGALAMIGQFIPPDLQGPLEDAAAQILPFMGDYGIEIESGAKLINVSIGKAVLLNIVYDLTAYCTSIVAHNSKGEIFHGRNLDYNLANVLQNITINVEFQSKNQTVYKGTTYAGYVGLPTGLRLNSFAISLDERDKGSILDNILAAVFTPGVTGPTFLIRDALQQATTFDSALLMLQSVPLAAPCYLIISGITQYQGAVVTRDREYTLDTWVLEGNRWYEVETNYDHWKPAGDDRRKVANEVMLSIGEDNIDLNGILKVLSTPPVLNNQTTYTTLMSAMNNTYITYIR